VAESEAERQARQHFEDFFCSTATEEVGVLLSIFSEEAEGIGLRRAGRAMQAAYSAAQADWRAFLAESPYRDIPAKR
jgi:hypothetical protein